MNHMTERGANCTLSEDEISFSFQTSFEDRKCENNIRYIEEEQVLQLSSIVKVEGKLASINFLLDFINKINRVKMYNGFFVYLEEEREIEFRSSIEMLIGANKGEACNHIVYEAFKAMHILEFESDEFISNTN